jgi:hypothetical protein
VLALCRSAAGGLFHTRKAHHGKGLPVIVGEKGNSICGANAPAIFCSYLPLAGFVRKVRRKNLKAVSPRKPVTSNPFKTQKPRDPSVLGFSHLRDARVP